MKVSDYTYPPELCYYGNSPVHVNASTTLTSDSYPNGVEAWRTSTWDGWTKNSSVASNTRGVAMANNIQYGMAVFETRVLISASTLYDNFKALHTDNDNDNAIAVDGNSFTLKGVLIGGQPSCVNWLYMPWESYKWQGADGAPYPYTDTAHENYPEKTYNDHKVIYDKDINTWTNGNNTYTASTIPVVTTTNPDENKYSQPNYTVVFDNFTNETNQKDVYVALEFVNNTGKDFWGYANVVRNEGTFYLLAKLTPPTYADSFWPDTYQGMMPPYDGNGVTLKTPRVFMADHKTVAKFKIGPNSLKYAFVTVPDLRAAQMSLGLSVDLNWVNGGDYTLEFNGGQ